MKKHFQQLLFILSSLTRFTTLQRSARLVILLHLFYYLADGLSNIFVGVYIWKIEHNLYDIALFYFSHSLAFLLLSPWIGKQLKRFAPHLGIGIGSFCLALFYFILFLLQDQAINYLPLLGFLQGTGAVFYWTSYHYLSISLTQEAERNLFNGYTEVSQAIATLLTPLIAGGIIVSQIGNKGYPMIFLLSFLFFITTTIISLLIRLPRQPKQIFRIKPILKDFVRPQKRWFWSMQANIMQGISDGLFQMLPSIIYFLFVHNEWNLGVMTSMLAFVTLLSNFLVGRLLTRRYRKQSILWGTLTHMSCAIPFFIYPSWITVILFAIGNALVKPWYFVPSLSTFFDYIHRQEAKEETYLEYLVSREIALSIGRLTSLAFLLILVQLFDQAQVALQWFTLFVALGLPYIWFGVHKLDPSTGHEKTKR